jgi:hypothetical protein
MIQNSDSNDNIGDNNKSSKKNLIYIKFVFNSIKRRHTIKENEDNRE